MSLVGTGTPPYPLPQASVPCPPPRTKGRGAHSPAAKGVGESQFRRLEKKLSTLPALWTSVCTSSTDQQIHSPPERRHGSTRVPGNVFLAWRSSWWMVWTMDIYYITAAGNSISSQLGSSCQGNRYRTEKAGGTDSPSCTKSHLPGHSPSSSQAGRRFGPAL
jgi:hypothetical protein